MITSIPVEKIVLLLEKQLNSNFTLVDAEKTILEHSFSKVMEKLEYCFLHTDNKYYSCMTDVGGKKTYFNPFTPVNIPFSILLCSHYSYANRG